MPKGGVREIQSRLCDACGIVITRYLKPSRVKRGLDRFCSRSCAWPNRRWNPGVPFMSRVLKGADCWLWTGAKTTAGYGEFHVRSRSVYAHRHMWRLVKGPIPVDLFVCHHCDNPSCVRPDHLFLGTSSDNMRDAARKGRIRGPWSKP